MTRQANQILWDQWRRRIDRQQESGLSIAEFCRKEHIAPHGFYVWRRRLRATTPSRRSSREAATKPRLRTPSHVETRHRRPRPASPDSAGAARSSGFLQLPVTTMQPSPWVELSLADGTVVRLPQQNLAALVTVLRVLRGDSFDLPSAEGGHA